MSIGPVDYTNNAIPEGYKCTKCGKTNCKLWRQYQTFADHIKLLCGKHALRDQKEEGPIDAEGFRPSTNAPTRLAGWCRPYPPSKVAHTGAIRRCLRKVLIGGENFHCSS